MIIGQNKLIKLLHLKKLMYDYGSPGKVFQLDEKSMEEYLEKLETEGKNFVFNRGAGGLRQINKVKEVSENQLLKNCYKKSSMSDLFSSVNINSSFQRSARIDNKISSEFLDHFVFHDTSKKVLNQISSSLLNSNQSGFTLTGPYGTGKSSLALFLKALISKESAIKKQAENIAKFNNKHLFSRVFLNKKSWFTLNVIGSKDDPIDSIAEQIDQTVNENWISKTIPPILKTKTKKTVAGVIKSLNNLVLELNKKNHGLILIVDEMGKFLDYASSVGSDLNLFQEIAENFSNNRLNKEGEPVFIGILHQPFEEYASSLGRTIKRTGRKYKVDLKIFLFQLTQKKQHTLLQKQSNKKNLDQNLLN